MPHINLLYPFVPNNEFVDAIEKVKGTGFSVKLNSTLWLFFR